MKPADLLALARPWQWTKNGVVLAGIIFGGHLGESDYQVRAVVALAAFCLASSAIYVFNDVLDRERDRRHPEKRLRPVAAGRVSPAAAVVFGSVLLAGAAGLGQFLGPQFLGTIGAFLGLNLLYSAWLKQLPVLDVMAIAISFVLRALGGVAALRPLDPELAVSPWLLLCTFFLALFLGFGKRRHELQLLEAEAADHRGVLAAYSIRLVDEILGVMAGATLIAYAIYTVAPGTVERFHTGSLVYTVPFVTYGIFRYLYLIHFKQEGGNPSRHLYRDVPILLTVLGWTATVVVLLYARGA